jgi:hypothetical protein
MAILYRHIRLDKNEPFYIGIGRNLRRAYRTDDRNDIWNKITNKTEYKVEILFDDLSWEDACKKEKEFISMYGRIKYGGILANITLGGEGGVYEKTKEHRIKISNTLKSVLKQDHNKGFKNPMFGKKHNEEAKNNISLKNKGKRSKIVVDIQSGIFYYSVDDAAKCYNINYKTLNNMLAGHRRNSTNLRYING